MAIHNDSPSGSFNDEHDDVLAYLASVRPLRGCDVSGDETLERGWRVLFRIASKSAPQLTLRDCADALNFVHRVEPIGGALHWDERGQRGEAFVVSGLNRVLELVESTLRATAGAGPGTRSVEPEPPTLTAALVADEGELAARLEGTGCRLFVRDGEYVILSGDTEVAAHIYPGPKALEKLRREVEYFEDWQRRQEHKVSGGAA
jgi:hypothetical protein